MAKASKSYLESMVRQYGEDWLTLANPENIQNSAKRIAKDMSKNTIDYEKYGKYFLDSKFMENLIIAYTNEYEEASLHYNALVYYQQYLYQLSLLQQNNAPMPNIGPLIAHDQSLMFIYNTILTKLNNVRLTSNIAELYDLGATLFQYRNHLN